MHSDNPCTTVRIARHPIHTMLVPFPIVCFVGTLATDIIYWRMAEMTWANFSAWLLAVGLLFGVLAGLHLIGQCRRDGFRLLQCASPYAR